MSTSPHERIRMARRIVGMSQEQLARAVGVQRSAVSHWEMPPGKGKSPNVGHLRGVALATGTQFEWLVTGRGSMTVSHGTHLDSVAVATEALLIEDPQELRLVAAFREAPPRARLSLLEVLEELASQRTGRSQARRKAARSDND
jgi:transcriptional regulator with XRE-family HTH domain